METCMLNKKIAVFLAVLVLVPAAMMTAVDDEETAQGRDDYNLLEASAEEYGTAGFSSIAVNPDVTIAALGSNNGDILLYTVPDLKRIKRLKETALPGEHNRRITSLAFSPDGSTLAATWGYSIYLFDVESDEGYRPIQSIHRDQVTALLFTDDGQYLYSADNGGLIQKADVAQRRWVDLIRAHGRTITSLCFGLDNTVLISTSYDHSIKVWRLPDGEFVREFKGHRGPVTSAITAKDGLTLISGSTDQTIRMWHLETGAPITQHRFDRYGVTHLAASPDARFVAAGTRPVLGFAGTSHTIWFFATEDLRSLGNYPPLPAHAAVFLVTDDSDKVLMASGAGRLYEHIHLLRIPPWVRRAQ